MLRTPRTTLTAIAVTALVAIAGCSSHTGPSASGERAAPASSSTGTLVTGPGPQRTYKVQPQPAPGSCKYRYTTDKQPLPDPTCTPGAISPAVTQANIGDTICRTGGYTSTVRPPASITNKEKSANAKAYDYSGPLGDAELDHLVSLQLGGDPNATANLWVEPPSPDHIAGKGPNNDKDVVEARLHSAVCKRQVTLAAAQQAIAADWTTAEAKLGLKPEGGSAGSSNDGD